MTRNGGKVTGYDAEQIQVLHTPCIWMGYSPQHMYAPGSARKRERRLRQ